MRKYLIPPFTAIIRRSELQYVAVCLELNVSACGDSLDEVQKNLENAVNDYLDYAKETGLTPFSITLPELIEFLQDTQSPQEKKDKGIFRVIELVGAPTRA